MQGASAAAREMRIISTLVESTLLRMAIKAFVAISSVLCEDFDQQHPRM
jgi:hypothetical protein